MFQLYGNAWSVPLSKRRNLYATTEDDDAAVFEMLLADVDKSVTEVDSVLEANGLSTTEELFPSATVRTNDAGGIDLDVYGSKIMPFDIHATSDAVWLHLTCLIERMPNRSYYERHSKVRTQMHLITT